MLKYLESFNSVQINTTFVCKEISSDSFKNKITNKLLTNKLYVSPFNWVQKIWA